MGVFGVTAVGSKFAGSVFEYEQIGQIHVTGLGARLVGRGDGSLRAFDSDRIGVLDEFWSAEEVALEEGSLANA